MLIAAILVIFPFAMAHAAVSDMLSMTIANRVSLILIGSFAVIAPLTGMPLAMLANHGLAMLVVLLACFSLFALNLMGGGDAKLMAATALWFGLNMELLQYLLIGSVIGGALTLAILRYRRSPASMVAGRIDFLHRMADPKERIPYGIALGLAGLLIYPETHLAQWALVQLSAI